MEICNCLSRNGMPRAAEPFFRFLHCKAGSRAAVAHALFLGIRDGPVERGLAPVVDLHLVVQQVIPANPPVLADLAVRGAPWSNRLVRNGRETFSTPAVVPVVPAQLHHDAGQLGRAARAEVETNGTPKRDDERPRFAPRPGGDPGGRYRSCRESLTLK